MVNQIIIIDGPSEAEIIEIMDPKNPKDYVWFRDNVTFQIRCEVRTGEILKPVSYFLSSLGRSSGTGWGVRVRYRT